MSAAKDEQYDLSKKQREILEWKHARRMQLRELYQKEAYNPTKHNLLFDEQPYRHTSLKTMYEHRFKPNKESGLFMLGLMACFTFGYIFMHENRMEKYRRTMAGEVPIKDIKFKFT